MILKKQTHVPSVRTYAYVANYGSGTVTVIDTATNSVSANVTVGSHPDEVVVSC